MAYAPAIPAMDSPALQQKSHPLPHSADAPCRKGKPIVRCAASGRDGWGEPGMRRRHFRRSRDDVSTSGAVRQDTKKEGRGLSGSKTKGEADKGSHLSLQEMERQLREGLLETRQKGEAAARMTWQRVQGLHANVAERFPAGVGVSPARGATWILIAAGVGAAVVLRATWQWLRGLFRGSLSPLSSGPRPRETPLEYQSLSYSTTPLSSKLFLGALVLVAAWLAVSGRGTLAPPLQGPSRAITLPSGALGALVLGACAIGALSMLRAVKRILWGALASLGFDWGDGDDFSRAKFVRDRSLGGREVIASKGRGQGAYWWKARTRDEMEGVKSPLAPVGSDRLTEKALKAQRAPKKKPSNGASVKGTYKPLPRTVPDWWKPPAPDSVPRNQAAQEEARALVSAMVAKRLLGQDFSSHDIIQLYTLWGQGSGTASIKTENTRDELYRAVIKLALTACTSGSGYVQLRTSDVPTFLGRMAAVLQVPPPKGLTMVLAALAARARASLLQAWALRKQWRNAEALEELRQLSAILSILPPPQDSAEMELASFNIANRIPEQDRADLFLLFRGEVDKDTSQVVQYALALT